MTLVQQFNAFIVNENLFAPKDTLLLAVSGGIDSVVLCELCHQSGYDVVMAHCNFQLRGAESDRDELFVKNLAAKYQVPLLTQRFETAQYAAEKKVSIQVAARELRYAWFASLLKNEPATTGLRPAYIVTAHHLDDNIETMLMNFFKGTGIAGLRGMLPKQGTIVRPLLFAKKIDLISFAKEQALTWVEDSSNQSNKYTRNYVRNNLLPLVKDIYPEAENNLASNLRRFADIEVLYHQSIEQHKKKLLEYKGSEVHIPVLKLQKTVPLPTVLYEIIKPFHFSAGQLTDALALLNSETGKYIQSATHRIIRNRNWLIITPHKENETQHILIEAPGRILFSLGQLHCSMEPASNAAVPPSPAIAWLDAADISFPLLLRKWKTGDYFYPLGMRKKKKIARFLIDQKVSKTAKENTWVLESGKKIVWIAGHRIDDRFKITPRTKNILCIELKKAVQV